MAVLITPDSIKGKSTENILHDFMDDAEYSPLGTAPGFGVHTLLRLEEKDVHAEIPKIIETDAGLTTLSPNAITDDDIRAGCLAAVEHTHLTDEHGSAMFKAAMAAIRNSNLRLTPPD